MRMTILELNPNEIKRNLKIHTKPEMLCLFLRNPVLVLARNVLVWDRGKGEEDRTMVWDKVTKAIRRDLKSYGFCRADDLYCARNIRWDL